MLYHYLINEKRHNLRNSLYWTTIPQINQNADPCSGKTYNHENLILLCVNVISGGLSASLMCLVKQEWWLRLSEGWGTNGGGLDSGRALNGGASAVPVPMSSSCASLTGQESMSQARPPCAESPQTLCICSVWPRQHIQFSAICWAHTHAAHKGHHRLRLTRKHRETWWFRHRNHHVTGGRANGLGPERSVSALLNCIDIIGMYKQRWTERGREMTTNTKACVPAQ